MNRRNSPSNLGRLRTGANTLIKELSIGNHLSTKINPIYLVATANVGSRGLSIGANFGDGSGITKVLVDADTFGSSFQSNVVKNDMALVGRRAVST